MPRDARLLLLDLLEAGRCIQEFASGHDVASFQQDKRTRAATQRWFEIIGEALAGLRDHHPEVFAEISDGQLAIRHRQMIAHHYHRLDDAITLMVAGEPVRLLLEEVERLLARWAPED